MKRNKMMSFVMALLVSACAVVGCSAADDPTGPETVPAEVLETQQAPVYEVGVEFEGETHSVQAATTDALRAQLLENGFQGLHGEEAIVAFLTDVAQRTANETGELPEGVMTVGGHDGDPSERDSSATCVSCYDVYDCYASCSCCIYRYTVCYWWTC